MYRFSGREKLLSRIVSAVLGFLLFFMPAAQALPTGWEVVSGNVSFESQGTTLIITSSSNQAIINYQSFNIGVGETVNFIMPGDYASILNRILGGGPTSIEGALNSNGQVLLINPAGINFAQTANVNVAGLLASSTLTNQQYLSNDLIPNPATMVTSGGINNAGMLQATKYIILDGSSIVNEGTIVLAGGIENGRIVATAQNDVVNTGTINANGSDIEISANNIIQSGTLISEGSSGNDGGLINIQAMSDTHLTDSSFTSARGRGVNSNSGDVMIMSQGNTYFDSGAILDVSGGDVSGDGGFSEVSAKNIVFFNGQAFGEAVNGADGNILIDPTTIRIRNAGAPGGAASVPHATANNNSCVGGESCFLNTSFNGFANVTLEATDDIYVEDAWSLGAVTTGNTLGLYAGDDIFIQAALSTAGGNIVLAANYNLSGAPVPSGHGDITTTAAGSIATGGGNLTMTGRNFDLSGNINTGAGITTLTATGDITMQSGANMNSVGTLTATANNNITINNDFNTTGTLNFTADNDNAGGGTFATSATTDILTTGANGPTILSTGYSLVNGSTIVDTGAGNTILYVRGNGTLTVDNTISNTGGGGLYLDGSTYSGTNNIVLAATANLNTVNSLDVITRNNLTINNDFNTTGALSFTADSNTDGLGTLTLGATTDILTSGASGPTFVGINYSFANGSTIVDTGAGNTIVYVRNGGTLTVNNTISNTGGGGLYLDGSSYGGSNNVVLDATANLNTVGSLNVTARNNLTINNDFNTTGALNFTADTDTDGLGTLTLSATTDILTTGASGPTFVGINYNFANGSTIVDTGAGNTIVYVRNGGTLTVNNTISNTGGGGVYLDGSSYGGGNNIVLGATANLNTASSLNVTARNDITINNDFNTTGTLSFTADSDNDGTGTLALGATTDIITTGANGPTFTSTNFNLVNGSTIVDTGAGYIILYGRNGGTMTIDNTISNAGGTVYLDGGIYGGNNNILLGSNANLNTLSNLEVSARNNITMNNDFSTSATLNFNADSDNSGAGTFTLGGAANWNTTGTAPSITGTNVDLAAGSIINPNGSLLTVATKNGGNMVLSGTVTSTGNVIFNSVGELDVNSSADIYTVNTLKVNATTGLRLYTPITLTPGNTANYNFLPATSAAKYDFNPDSDASGCCFMEFGNFDISGLGANYTLNYPGLDLWFYNGTVSTGANTLTANAGNIYLDTADMSTSTAILNATNSISINSTSSIDNMTKLTANANNGITIDVPINLTAANLANWNFESPNTGVQWDFNPDLDGNGGFMNFGNNITLTGVDLTLNLPTASATFAGGAINTGANTLTVNAVDISIYDDLTTSRVILNASEDIWIDAVANIQNVALLTNTAVGTIELVADLTLTPGNVANYTFNFDADDDWGGRFGIGGDLVLNGLDYTINKPNAQTYFYGGSVSTGANTLTVNGRYVVVDNNMTTSNIIINDNAITNIYQTANVNNVNSMVVNADQGIVVYADIIMSAANASAFTWNTDFDADNTGDLVFESGSTLALSGVDYALAPSLGRNLIFNAGSTINTGANTLTLNTNSAGDISLASDMTTSNIVINSDDLLTLGANANLDDVANFTANAKGNIDYFTTNTTNLTGQFAWNADSDLNGNGNFTTKAGSTLVMGDNPTVHGYDVVTEFTSFLFSQGAAGTTFTIQADNDLVNGGHVFGPNLYVKADTMDINNYLQATNLTLAPLTANRTINLQPGLLADAESAGALDINQGETIFLSATGTLQIGDTATTGIINVKGIDFTGTLGNITLSTTGNIVPDASNPNITTHTSFGIFGGLLTITGGANVGSGTIGSAGTVLKTSVDRLSINTTSNAWITEADAVDVTQGIVDGNLVLNTSGAGSITLANMDITGTSDIQTFTNSNSIISTSNNNNIFRGPANFDTNDSTWGHMFLTGDFQSTVSAWGDGIEFHDTAGALDMNGVTAAGGLYANTMTAGPANSITMANVDVGGFAWIITSGNDSDITGTNNITFRGNSQFETNDLSGGDITLTADFQGSVSLSGDVLNIDDTAGGLTVGYLISGLSAYSTVDATHANGWVDIAIYDAGIAGPGKLVVTADKDITARTAGAAGGYGTTDTHIFNSNNGGDINFMNITSYPGFGDTALTVGHTAAWDPNLINGADWAYTNGGEVTFTNVDWAGTVTVATNNANISGTGNTFRTITSFNSGTADISLTTTDFRSANNVFTGNDVVAQDSADGFIVSGITATGTATLSASANGANRDLTVSNASVTGATSLTAYENITATVNNNFGTLTALGGTSGGYKIIAITEQGDMNINSVINQGTSGIGLAETHLQSLNGRVLGKGTAVVDVSGMAVSVIAGDNAADTNSYANLTLNAGVGSVYAYGKNATNDSLILRGTTGNFSAGYSYLNVPGDIILGDATANMNVGGWTGFYADGEVIAKGSFDDQIVGTGLRVNLTQLGGRILSNITATGNSNDPITATTGPLPGASKAVINLFAPNSYIQNGGVTANGVTALNGNVVLQAGDNGAIDTTAYINNLSVNVGGNLRMFAAGDTAGNNTGTTIGITGGSVGGYITANGEAWTFTDGAVNINLTSGNLNPSRIQANGNVTLTANNGSIIQDNTLAFNDKSIYTYGDTTLTAQGAANRYIDVGLRGYSATSDLTIRAQGSSDGTVNGTAVDLNGYVGGNLNIRDHTGAGTANGLVRLGNTLGGSVTDLDDTYQLFDGIGSVDVTTDGDIIFNGSLNQGGAGNINMTGRTITGNIDLGHLNLGTGQLNATGAGGTGINITNYKGGIIATGANAIQAANSNVILQAGSAAQIRGDQWIAANINVGAGQSITLTAWGKNTGTGHTINVIGSGPAVPIINNNNTTGGTCTYLGSPC